MYVQVFPLWQKRLRVLGSTGFSLFMIGCVIMIVISIIVYRLAVTLAVAKSAKDPASSLSQNGMDV